MFQERMQWRKCLLLGLLLLSSEYQPSARSATDLFWSAKDGKIHTDIDSPYNLRNPSSFWDLHDQEHKLQVLKYLETSLEDMRSGLDEVMIRDDEGGDIEKVILQTNSDCARAGDLYKKLNLFESVVLSLEDKGFKTEDFINIKWSKSSGKPGHLPDCNRVIPADTTSSVFKLFKGLSKKPLTTVNAEPGLMKVTAGMTVSDYGFAVGEALKKNSSSWALYNMATFYYRILGEASVGLECGRRALHFAPKKHKDMALINIASLLFRGDHSADAVAATNMAIESSGDSAAVHTLRGFIFASISRFEKSIEAFAKAGQLGNERSRMEKYGYAIKCHAKVHQGLSDQHEKLRDVIRQFELINVATEDMDTFTKAFAASKLPSAKALAQIYNLRNIWKYPMNFGFLPDGTYNYGLEETGSLMRPRWNSMISVGSPALGFEKFPGSTVPEIHIPLADWPSQEECELHVRKEQTARKSRLVIQLLETKGFPFWYVVGPLKATFGIPPPYCETFNLPVPKVVLDMLKFSRLENQKRFPEKDAEKVIDDYFRSCGRVLEFGQKLTLAHGVGLLPSWMYFNAAAIYWRATGHTHHAAECLARAYYSTPTKHRDLALINLATFFSFLNETDSSLAMAKEAADIGLEPVTLYTMGVLLASHGFLSLALKNFRLALMQDLTFYPAVEALRSAECTMRQDADADVSEELVKNKNFPDNVIEISIIDARSGGIRFVKSSSLSKLKGDFASSDKMRFPVRISLRKEGNK